MAHCTKSGTWYKIWITLSHLFWDTFIWHILMKKQNYTFLYSKFSINLPGGFWPRKWEVPEGLESESIESYYYGAEHGCHNIFWAILIQVCQYRWRHNTLCFISVEFPNLNKHYTRVIIQQPNIHHNLIFNIMKNCLFHGHVWSIWKICFYLFNDTVLIAYVM